MKRTYTFLFALVLSYGLLLAQEPEKPPIEEEEVEIIEDIMEVEDEEIEVWDTVEDLESEDQISSSMFRLDKASFRVKQDDFELHNLLEENDWPENWEGEAAFKEFEKQIFVLDFTGGLDKGIALKLLEPYMTLLADPDASINLYYTDEDISDKRISAIRNNLENGIPDRPKKIQIWLHQWPDNNLGILVANPIK